ncbi:hypothetical protein Vadar_007516 [Vaccinium darrowii]|uniref:Uncharacterized protein n=1 Tax=Vaccinium darrowii TaxID=229202 RepID=A0ACB7Z9X9_9ERIC|nr:hypothetical protein Vadar_007516 [Vaccinium darrowii]
MEIHKEKKTSMGRQRIEIKKIEKSSRLQVTFSKRKSGIFKKASELSVLCGADVAIIVSSPAGKVFAFGNPSVDAVVDRFLARKTCCEGSETESGSDVHLLRDKHDKVVKELEAEEEREKAVEAARGGNGGGGLWWNESIDGLGLNELEQYKAALEVLKSKVMRRADEMAAAARAFPGSSLVAGGSDPYLSCIEQNDSFGFNFD